VISEEIRTAQEGLAGDEPCVRALYGGTRWAGRLSARLILRSEELRAVGAQNGAGWRRFIEAFSALARTGSSGIFGGQFCRAVIGFGVARGVW
jgi:hypothetical protein